MFALILELCMSLLKYFERFRFHVLELQVGRSSASSVAFGMGMFTGQGTLGPGKQQAFAVLTDSKGRDIHLRFHETCMAYKVFS